MSKTTAMTLWLIKRREKNNTQLEAGRASKQTHDPPVKASLSAGFRQEAFVKLCGRRDSREPSPRLSARFRLEVSPSDLRGASFLGVRGIRI